MVLKKEGSRLERNVDFGFLYKKTSIRAYVISEIALVPEYTKALKAYNGKLTDSAIYEVIKETFIQMQKEGGDYRTARDIINKISKDVTGDSATWHND